MAKLTAREQAAWYVTRLYSGELTAREEAQLRLWRRANPVHEHEWQQALNAYDISAQLYYRSAPAWRAQHDWRSWFASAASIALVAVLVLLTQQPPSTEVETVQVEGPAIMTPSPSEPQKTLFRITERQPPVDVDGPQHYRTDIGEVSHVTLTDGSTVSLNTDSELTVTYTAAQRLVHLSRGEVFFDVAKDQQRPFVIDTGSRRIEVLGTQFNVRKRDDERVLKIAVLEGKVAVRQSAETTIDEPQQQLLAGDIAAYGATSEVVQQNQQRQVSSAQAWRQGVVRFDNESLDTVVKEFNRYRTRKISITDEQAKQLRISGVFHLANGENILTALESTLPIQVKRYQQHITIGTK